MTTNFQKKLKTSWTAFTPSQQMIATYLLHNTASIPFETAASISTHAGVSPMTVGRFLRKLGYAGLGELKKELRKGAHEAPWLELYKRRSDADGSDFVTQNLAAEMEALVRVYRLAETEAWNSVVARIANADKVSVASFQMARFIGLGFASLLQHVKPNTSFFDGADGSYATALLDSGGTSCVVLIDFRRYSEHFRVLAEEVAVREIPLIIITDTQCYWAHELTDDVLMVPTDLGRSWHSFGSILSLLSLLLEAVMPELGDVYDRISDIAELRQKFIGYVGQESVSESKRAGKVPTDDHTSPASKRKRRRKR